MAHQFRRDLLLNTLKVYDLLIAALVFGFVAGGAGHAGWRDLLSERLRIQDFLLLLGFLSFWHGSFRLFGLYHSRRLSRRRGLVLDCARATSLGTLTLFAGGVAFREPAIDSDLALTFWMATTAVAAGSRVLLRFLLGEVRRRGRNLRHLLIVGANARTRQFAERLESRPELGYTVLGFVDEEWSGSRALEASGFERVATLAEFQSFIRDRVVDEVLIGLPMRSAYPAAARVIAQCLEQGLVVRYMSSLFDVKMPHAREERFDEDFSVVTVDTGPMVGVPIVLKRCLDFVMSLALIGIFSPLMLGVALLVKVTSPGPILFAQDRVGLNKRRFRLYKFRTMVADAEIRQPEMEHLNEASGPVFKIRNDPRITAVGRLLRRTSIDELPQLFNVLKGDMSLVGPRPLPLRDYRGFTADWERRRFSVRPGITCLWQVNGRGSLPFEQWMELDMKYIDEWSLLLDLKILAKTVPAVLRGSGAS